LLNATIRHHIEQYRCEESKFVDALLRAIYVDDLNSGGNDDDSVYMFYKKAKPGLAKEGLNLRKFVTNSPGLMENTERNESTLFSKPAKDISTSHNSEQHDAVDEDETYSKIALGIEPTTSESEQRRQRVLGVNWNFVEDQLVFDLSGIAELAKTCEPTKRNIVRLSAKFYDPFGYMSPITVQFKQMFQELYESKVGWNDEISHPIRVKCEKLVAGTTEDETLSPSPLLFP
jgi:hypothetical protein